MNRALPAFLVLLIFSVACGGDETDANDVALGYVWGTISQNKEPERLRELMTDDLDSQTTDAELADSILCFPIGLLDVLVSQDVERNGDTAMISATYKLSDPAQGGGSEAPRTVVRVWEFEQVEDGWLLSDLPSCT